MLNSKPLVTIITITFNLKKERREKYFRQCVDSVHGQTYENIEHIIVDGASEDGTLDLIKEYADKGWIRYISEPDKGVYDAMNKGIKLAKGKYIAFLNSDDFYSNERAVELSAEALEKEKADFSYANLIVIGENKTYIERGEIEKFIYTMPFTHPTMFTKTEVLKKENGLDVKFKMPADYDLIIRLIMKNYKPVYIDSEIATYRLGGLGCTTEHSDDIAKIYVKNYSPFFEFANLEQAKKIMYEQKIPNGFTEKFKKFFERKKMDNISLEKVIPELERREHVPVFLSSDNNFSPFVATTILSIMENTNSFVDIFILDGGIYEINKKKIHEACQGIPNLSIEFIRIDTKKEFKNFPTRLHFSIDMYARYLIPNLKPDLDKVIYSDVDVIFNGDITRLYEEDLNGFPLGAVPYTYGYLNPDKQEIKTFHKRLGLSYDHKYFESGLLLIDCKEWREKNITEKLIEQITKSDHDVLLTPDQDALNIFFENNYQQLGNEYIVAPGRTYVMLSDEKTKDSIKNPYIFHYTNLEKPWDNPDIEFSEYFWSYARKTPFYEELLHNFVKRFRIEYRKKIQIKEITSPKRFFQRYRFKFKFFWIKFFCRFLDTSFSEPVRKLYGFLRKLRNKLIGRDY